MSALFSPIKLRSLELANRIVVSPMCQYSAENGAANDWHFTHINMLALSGAAMFCIEATHVEAIGRITPGCLGLYSDANEAALKPIPTTYHSLTEILLDERRAHVHVELHERFFADALEAVHLTSLDDEDVPGAVVDGPAIFNADLGQEIDNFEGIDAHVTPEGETVLTLVSDDNFSLIQRTLLMQFTLLE